MLAPFRAPKGLRLSRARVRRAINPSAAFPRRFCTKLQPKRTVEPCYSAQARERRAVMREFSVDLRQFSVDLRQFSMNLPQFNGHC
jgi:hypothetical protein